MSYRFADSLRAGSGWNCVPSWFLKFILGMKLYMFRTVPLSIIRSFIYCTHSNGICHTDLLTACEQDQDGTAFHPDFSNLFLEWNSTCFGQFLCPSSGVLFTVHTATVYVIQICWQLASRIRMERSSILILLASCQQTCMTYTTAVCTVNRTPYDGQRNCPKHVEFHSKNKFEKLVHLVGFIIRNLTRCTVTWTSKRITSKLWNKFCSFH